MSISPGPSATAPEPEKIITFFEKEMKRTAAK
jgi:hypothetical protein